jgi:glycosyltransferase involved in cell wall biosynthesis
MAASTPKARSEAEQPSTPRSVLLVTPQWTRDGGVGAHVAASAAALAAHGLRVEVLTARVQAGDRIPGVRILGSPRLLDSGATMDTRIGEALAGEPAVIHLHQVHDPRLVDSLRASAPVVLSAHAYAACPSGVHYFRPGHECTRAHGPGCVLGWARGCAHTRSPQTLPGRYVRAGRAGAALQRVDLAIAYSRAVDRHLAVNGVTRRALVPLFATMAPATGSGHEARRRVVYAGRVVKPKGVAVLIRAAAHVNAEFVICGDGRGLSAIRELARRLGVQDRVHFRGWLSGQALAQELADASVVAMPSLWPEPFGLVGIEALAAGRPVVASGAGGVIDWLEHGVTGLRVAPGDPRARALALDELLADPARQQAMGLAGRRVVAARFSAERHVGALLDAYRVASASWCATRS